MDKMGSVVDLRDGDWLGNFCFWGSIQKPCSDLDILYYKSHDDVKIFSKFLKMVFLWIISALIILKHDFKNRHRNQNPRNTKASKKKKHGPNREAYKRTKHLQHKQREIEKPKRPKPSWMQIRIRKLEYQNVFHFVLSSIFFFLRNKKYLTVKTFLINHSLSRKYNFCTYFYRL